MATKVTSFRRNGFFACLCMLLPIISPCGVAHGVPPVLPLPPGLIPPKPKPTTQPAKTAEPVVTITLVSHQDPLPSVVTTDKKNDAAAAEDLCHYLSRVTSREITVVQTPGSKGAIIHVGRDAFVKQHAPKIEKLFADGYIIKYVKSGDRVHLILAGKLPASSQWAVEQFLRDYCGVRWLFPDPVYGEVVPARSTIAFNSDLSKTYEPHYSKRADLAMYYHNRNRTGLRLRPGGIGQYGGHAIQAVFKSDEYRDHPEWFAFFAGKRQWWKYGNGWQICTTNRETVKHMVKYVLDYFSKNPDAPTCSVGQNDGGGWCMCEKCRKFIMSTGYKTTGRWFHWVNQVAKEVGKKYPDKWIEALAYVGTAKPPRFKLEPNVAITKTIVGEGELKLAEDWMKVCRSVNLYSYMYGSSFLGFRHYPHAAKDYLKWGHDKLKALAHVGECNGDWSFDGPKYHYIQALQWDVNADVNEIMNDFCQHSYGKAAGPMREFWDRLEEIYERRGRKKRLAFYKHVSWQMALRPNQEFLLYRPDDVKFLDKCIAAATRLAAGDTPHVQFRVERISDAWKYYRTMLVSFMTYFKIPLCQKIASRRSWAAAVKLARKVADLLATRKLYFDKLLAYKHINPRMAMSYYWAFAVGITIFSHEKALIDDLCTSVSLSMRKSLGTRRTLDFWHKVQPSDSLYETARMQIYALTRRRKKFNLLINHDFETGNFKGWAASGGRINVMRTRAHKGKYAARMGRKDGDSERATISQRVAIPAPGPYRLTVRAKNMGKVPKDNAPPGITIECYQRTRMLWTPPTRNTIHPTQKTGDWAKLVAILDVPDEADSVLVRLNKWTLEGTVLWDSAIFERMLPRERSQE